MSEMRTLLNKYRALYPDAELSDDLNRIVTGSSPFAEPSSASGSPRPPASQPPSSIMSPLSPVTAMYMNDFEPEFDPSDDEISARNNLAKNFENLHIHHESFLGKSSSMMFLQAALESKQEYVVGGPTTISAGEPTPQQTSASSSDYGKGKGKEVPSSARTDTFMNMPRLLANRRLEYWQEVSVSSVKPSCLSR